MNKSFCLVAFWCGLILFVGRSAQAAYSFTPIDYPGEPYSATFGNSNAGHLAGEYRDPFGTYHAYIFSNESFESFDFPGKLWTSAEDVNSVGDTAGVFGEPFTGYTKAFIRVAGNCTELVPATGSTYTQAGGINDAGHVTGSYYVSNLDRGFIFNGSTFTTGLNVPGAVHTIPLGINNSDWVVGNWRTPNSVQHGFLKVGESYTKFDYPGASSTVPVDVNDFGTIVGYYRDMSGSSHGFLRTFAGVYSTIDPYLGSPRTEIRGINNLGQLSGFYDETNGVRHGFIGLPNPDFNGDGNVDAADYVFWRKTSGTAEQYNNWRANFDSSPFASFSGLADAQSVSRGVPEPSCLVMTIAGVVGLLAWPRRSHQNLNLTRKGAR